LTLPQGGDRRDLVRHTWPWLMAAMTVAALAIR